MNTYNVNNVGPGLADPVSSRDNAYYWSWPPVRNVIRGGDYYDSDFRCSAGYREVVETEHKNGSTGFRPARTLFE